MKLTPRAVPLCLGKAIHRVHLGTQPEPVQSEFRDVAVLSAEILQEGGQSAAGACVAFVLSYVLPILLAVNEHLGRKA